ncbi:MAG TPA: outer membrane protein [Xanthobacteraceae bacterium]|jgi:outer membrane immunogenic protein|nr:outer membrane protein [Xanthobacteraceae bacterium]
MKKILFASLLVAFGSGSAFAADMAARMPVKAAPMIAPVSSWQGFYVGGNIGYGWGNGRASNSSLTQGAVTFLDPSTLNTDPDGVIGGGQIGYNWQMGSLVTGLEVDIQGSGIKGSNTKAPFTAGGVPTVGSSLSFNERISWFGTVRGRLGFTATPSLLLYATGGLAYGEVKDSANVHFAASGDFPASVSKTKAGWTAGAGGEWMFAPNWSAKIEYLYVDLGNQSASVSTAAVIGFGATPINYDWKNQDHIVRAGVNYHF